MRSSANKPPRLLVVDDEYFNFEMLKVALSTTLSSVMLNQVKAVYRQQLLILRTLYYWMYVCPGWMAMILVEC